MAIINDYADIAKRLRELTPATTRDADGEVRNLDEWKQQALETARVYVEHRRRGGPWPPPIRRRQT